MSVSITVKVAPETSDRVRQSLARSGATLSEFVREAIEEKLARGDTAQTPYDLAIELGLVGAYKGRSIDSERSERKRRVRDAIRAKHSR